MGSGWSAPARPRPGDSADPATAVATSDSFAYRPMGFARITKVRCYDATGAVLPSPLFTFTHVTSDASGPC